jgi:hypothetical protein
MRRTLLFLGLAAAVASPALAQGSRGAFGLDARFAPTTGLGFAYYATDGLSLRPWLGLGYSGYQGFYANVGVQVRYELSRRDLSPYVSASAQYSHSGSTSAGAPSYEGRYERSSAAADLGQFGAGVGLRYRLSGKLGLFGEGRVLYATSPVGPAGTGWSTVTVDDRTRVEAVLGLSYLFR